MDWVAVGMLLSTVIICLTLRIYADMTHKCIRHSEIFPDGYEDDEAICRDEDDWEEE